jgi:putative spermidine/putrescine transport system permease protein
MSQRLSTYTLQLLLYGVLATPLVLFAVYAFSERWFFPALVPQEWTASPFARLLSDRRTLQGLGESLSIAAAASLLSLAISFPAARTLGLRAFRGRQAAWLAFFVPTVVPPLAIGMGLNIFFLQIGLAGSMLGVTLAHLVPTLPYTIFTLSSVFARYDENYEHQALALGANPVQIFFRITLRLVFPGLVVAGLFAFLISWSQYLLTLLIGGGRVLTLPMLLFSSVSGGNPASIAALSLLFVTPPVLVIAATARYLGQHGAAVQEQY